MKTSEEPHPVSPPSLDHSSKNAARTVRLEVYKTLTPDELKRQLGTAYFGSNALLALHFETTTASLILNLYVVKGNGTRKGFS